VIAHMADKNQRSETSCAPQVKQWSGCNRCPLFKGTVMSSALPKKLAGQRRHLDV